LWYYNHYLTGHTRQKTPAAKTTQQFYMKILPYISVFSIEILSICSMKMANNKPVIVGTGLLKAGSTSTVGLVGLT
jgi:hypothetical protein